MGCVAPIVESFIKYLLRFFFPFCIKQIHIWEHASDREKYDCLKPVLHPLLPQFGLKSFSSV